MSNEDDLLAGIRDHVRAERADDAALEAVARGELGSEGVAELERRASGDAEVAAMIEASRPLGAAVEEWIAARIGAKADANAKAKANAKGGTVVAFMRRAAVYGAPLALAAGVLLYVTLGSRGGETGRAMLPDYSIVASGDKEMRGQDDTPAGAVLRLRGGSDAGFEIVARPSTASGKKVVAYVFAMGEGEPNPVDASVDVAAEGSVRIRGRARALDGAR